MRIKFQKMSKETKYISYNILQFNNYYKTITFIPDKIVINARALIAPDNTVSLGCFIAIIAAMKNVLSPNSDTMITDKDATIACRKPNLSDFSDAKSGDF